MVIDLKNCLLISFFGCFSFKIEKKNCEDERLSPWHESNVGFCDNKVDDWYKISQALGD